MAKVIHVHLVGKRRDYYFASISAVYNVLTEEEVGAKKSYLLHAGLSGNGTSKDIIGETMRLPYYIPFQVVFYL